MTISTANNTRLSKSENQWINEKILQFDDSLRQNFNKDKVTFYKALTYFLSNSTSAISAIFYELKGKELYRVTGYAAQLDTSVSIGLGEQIVGQCAKNQESILFNEIPSNYASVLVGDNKVEIKNLFLIPLVFNKVTYGVIELRYINNISNKITRFVNRAANNAAVMMESIRKSEETNAQKEQLAKQEKYLKDNINDLQKVKHELQEQNTLVENTLETLSQQNKRIEESINYAKRIQQSILPSKETLNSYFKNSFSIFKPKDMVSGDFFWQAESGRYYFLAVVDCTGHGVPGAFMSMIGNTLLNQIILEKNEFKPEKILAQLHQGVVLNLVQTEGKHRDGMDMMLCRFEKKDKGEYEVLAAGAKSHLFVVKGKKVEHYKGNSQSIGGEMCKEKLHFDQKAFLLPSGSKVILLTDGWIDTANLDRRRYGTKRFRNTLQDNASLTLNGLKTRLEEDMKQFKGENDEQRDDITLIGIEL